MGNERSLFISFPGKERDAETGLDFFEARYYSSPQGRFMSPDEPLFDQSPEDPQSWNLYGYVRNNPLRFADPNGRECVKLDGGGYGDNGTGSTCKEANLDSSQTVTVTAKKGNVVEAFAWNTFFAVSNAANDYFRFLTDAIGIEPSYMKNIPTNSESTGKIPNGAVFVGSFLVGPESEGATLLTRWGYKGAAKWRNALKVLRRAGTHENIGDIVPTLKEGVEMIKKAGGTIERIDKVGHAAGGVSDHTYPHINYTTSAGEKATLRIEPK
jgi:RHS repeat-associated protein